MNSVSHVSNFLLHGEFIFLNAKGLRKCAG